VRPTGRIRYARLSASQRAGVVAAAASVPRSLTPLLRPRSAVDQGVVSGLSAAMAYGLTTVTHDGVLAASAALRRLAGRRGDGRATAQATLVVDVAAAVAARIVLRALPPDHEARPAVRAVRFAAGRAGAAAAAGVLPAVLDGWPGRGRVAATLRSGPAAVAAGAGIAAGVQLAREARLGSAGIPSRVGQPAPVARALVAGAVTAAGALGLAALERTIARRVERPVHRLTGTRGLGPLLSHALSAAVIGTGLVGAGTLVAHRVEIATRRPDPDLREPPASPTVSGGPGSAVAWHTLDREARRHLAGATPAADIARTMGEPARDPIRVYVGIGSARTVEERVGLVLAELERTGALDRSLLVLCSPTGSGYVNHAAVAAWEHLSRGDCATVTVQYAARPSTLSLGKVGFAVRQNRATWEAVARALAARGPGRRPRVVLFGESLGATTSQDVFRGTGTVGPRRLFVQRGLWLGTPAGCVWARELRQEGPRVDRDEVLAVGAAEDLDDLPPAAARRARWVFLAHPDDAVPLFGTALLWREPDWLGPARSPLVPPQAVWSTPITFLQCAVDAKNAVARIVPGDFTQSGHDYRGDLARTVRFAFDLPADDAQLARVEEALRRDEVARAARWS